MRIHDFFSRFHKPAPDQLSDDASPELEQLTDKLIAEAKVELQRVFDQQMAKRTKPLGTEDAKMILEALIKATVARRELLIGRLEKDLEEGRLYRRYLQKMEVINELTSDSHIKAKVMVAMEDDYIAKRRILKNITRPVYADAALNNMDLSDRDKAGIAVDLNEEMQLQKLSVISRDILRKTHLDQQPLEWEELDDSVIVADSVDQDDAVEPGSGGQADDKQDGGKGSEGNDGQNDEGYANDGDEVIE